MLKTGNNPSRQKSFVARLSKAILSSPKKGTKMSKPSSSEMHTAEDITSLENAGEEIESHVSAHCVEHDDEPGYSTVRDVDSSQNYCEPHPPPVPPKTTEALYSTVNKKKLLKENKMDRLDQKHGPKRHKKDDATISKRNARSTSSEFAKVSYPVVTAAERGQHTEKHAKNRERRKQSYDEEIEVLKENHLEELRQLRHEIQQADEENEMLRSRVMDLLSQERKWKHEMAETRALRQENLYAAENNAELNRRIAKLEADTKQEVQLLLEQVKLVKHEKEVLSSQLQALQTEHQALLKKYNSTCLEKHSMISVEQHLKSMNEIQKQLDEATAIYHKEIESLKDLFMAAEEEKNSLIIELKLLKEESKKYSDENRSLKKQHIDESRSREILVQEVHELKQREYDALNLLVSLIKIAEEVISERDVFLRKSQIQEEQRKIIHSTAMDYSVNVGRLEEHIVNMQKTMTHKMKSYLNSKNEKDVQFSVMSKSYEMQLDILRRKLVQKNCTLASLAKDKMKLEQDMRNFWQGKDFQHEEM